MHHLLCGEHARITYIFTNCQNNYICSLVALSCRHQVLKFLDSYTVHMGQIHDKKPYLTERMIFASQLTQL